MKFGFPELLLAGLALLLWKGRASAEPSKTGPSPAHPKKPADVVWPQDQPPLPTPPEPRQNPVRPNRTFPDGFSPVRFTTGLHGEPGVYAQNATGDGFFLPSDENLDGYRVPGGSKDIP